MTSQPQRQSLQQATPRANFAHSDQKRGINPEVNTPATRARKSVYVIEDELDIAQLIQFNLSAEGYCVETYHSGEAGLEAIRKKAPDLVVLDLMLPGVDGHEICRQLKSDPKSAKTPIVMVTAKGEEQDVITGLELGADDYVTKPFSPKVLVARVNAVARRAQTGPLNKEAVIKVHALSIHPGRHEVKWGENPLVLTSSEFQILHLLARRPGWVFTRSQIVDSVRGENYAVTERSIDVQIVGLRKKLGEAADLIETVRGVGYRFREENEGDSGYTPSS